MRFPRWGDPNARAIAQPFSIRSAARRARRAAARRRGAGAHLGLSQRLKQGAATPFAYVQRVERYLEGGFSYSETPPTAAQTLDGFLFDARTGFCQQYSGAMGLLLRMAGIPTRVAAGFTPGSLDRDDKRVRRARPRRPFLGRGVVPGLRLGHARPDAGGGPAALAAGRRRQRAERTRPTGARAAGRQLDRRVRRGGRRVDGGTPVALIVLGAVAAVAAVAGLVLERRRRKRLPPPALRPMAEFERALRRARYDPGPGVTLTGIERAFAGWPGAAAYVRALREQRYSGRPWRRRGTSAARCGRRSPAAAGVLRSWWALPPQAPVHRRRAADEDDVEIVRRAPRPLERVSSRPMPATTRTAAPRLPVARVVACLIAIAT